MSQRIGLYGGSFDPIHFGHLIPARAVAEKLSIDRIVLIPSARPPHKTGRSMTSAEDRMAMARLAVEGDPLFEVSDVELHRPGPSYTFDTVRHFREAWGPDPELFWIIGADSLPELPTWYRIGELVRCVRIVTVTRPAWVPPPTSLLEPAVGEVATRQLLADCISTPPIGISATEIRERVQERVSIRYLTPEPVRQYIESKGIYRG